MTKPEKAFNIDLCMALDADWSIQRCAKKLNSFDKTPVHLLQRIVTHSGQLFQYLYIIHWIFHMRIIMTPLNSQPEWKCCVLGMASPQKQWAEV